MLCPNIPDGTICSCKQIRGSRANDDGEFDSCAKGQEIKWSDGSSVYVALMKPKTASGTVISRRIFNMTPDDVSKYWLAMVFQGRIRAAKFFNEESDLIKYVMQTKGAIGVIPSENQAGSNIRIIIIDGSEYL